ncbi:hypothetical protein F2P81_018207 [Scophthalmus maximus]|uniref:Uncharacterized protein n=1 Tax=Scophthalmus maximus TaxID=52904 RepID=A0A6A4SF42_SCOMX|nr:hypothetical protein F2P81_018207 [Scophthalmus maximus]
MGRPSLSAGSPPAGELQRGVGPCPTASTRLKLKLISRWLRLQRSDMNQNLTSVAIKKLLIIDETGLLLGTCFKCVNGLECIVVSKCRSLARRAGRCPPRSQGRSQTLEEKKFK